MGAHHIETDKGTKIVLGASIALLLITVGYLVKSLIHVIAA